MTNNANGIEKEIKVKGHQLGTVTRPSGLPKTILHSTVKEREGKIDRKRGRSDYPRTLQDTPGHSKIPQDAFNSYIIHLFIHLFVHSDENKAKMTSNSFHFQVHSFEKVLLNTAEKP